MFGDPPGRVSEAILGEPAFYLLRCWSRHMAEAEAAARLAQPVFLLGDGYAAGILHGRVVGSGRLSEIGHLAHVLAHFATCEIDCLLYAKRSEEHTSELKSLMSNPYAVLFLKKKEIDRE